MNFTIKFLEATVKFLLFQKKAKTGLNTLLMKMSGCRNMGTFKPLYIKFMNFVNDYKFVYCWFRKDLSVINEKTK